MSETQREGLVVRRYGGFYYVFTGEAVLACKLRGKIRDQVVTGDRVVITVLGTGTGVVEKVLPRRTELVRPRIANVDKVFIVFSCNCPEPSLVLLDRLLVLASCHGLYPYIVLNKCDLDPAPRAVDIIDYYPRAGYKLILTSAVNGEGIDEVVKEVEGSISVLAGPSGVGKSSLLNAVFPDRYLPTQEISEKRDGDGILRAMLNFFFRKRRLDSGHAGLQCHGPASHEKRGFGPAFHRVRASGSLLPVCRLFALSRGKLCGQGIGVPRGDRSVPLSKLLFFLRRGY